MPQPITLLCLASYFKGNAFLRAAKQAGCRVLLLAKETYKDEDWARESLDDTFFMPDLLKRPDITYAVAYLARSNDISQIIALDDYDVETAGELRDHLLLPGMSHSLARHFRDKLTMRVRARDAGLPVPEFTGVFHHGHLRDFLARVPGPWVLKPRSEASSMGIKKIHHPEEIWPLLEAQGDQQSFFHLERFIPGDVFHVDSLVNEGQVVFALPHQYAQPPMSVYQGGGVFLTRSMDRESPEARALLDLNRQVLTGLGLPRGAAHAEYIRAHADGRYYFLECAARVGGANIAEAVEFATGINLWAEWARIEVAFLRAERYALPAARSGHAGVINCLARQEWPDLSGYDDPEVVWKAHKKQHAGLIVSAPDAARVEFLLNRYAERFAHDFLAVLPPQEKAT